MQLTSLDKAFPFRTLSRVKSNARCLLVHYPCFNNIPEKIASTVMVRQPGEAWNDHFKGRCSWGTVKNISYWKANKSRNSSC